MASKSMRGNQNARSQTDLPTFSRFAVLEDEEISSSDEETTGKKQKKDVNETDGPKVSKSAKKRARKKKKAAAENVSKNDLRQMAFGKTVSSNQATAIQSAMLGPLLGQCSSNVETSKEERPPKEHSDDDDDENSWGSWIKKDEKFVLDQFQRDLKEALKLSSSDAKTMKQNRVGISDDTHSTKEKKSSQKKEHATKMSLQEFQTQTTQSDKAMEHSLDTEIANNNMVELDSFYAEAIEHTDGPNVNKKNKKKKPKPKTTEPLEIEEKHSNIVNNDEHIHTNGLIEEPCLDPVSIAQWQNEIEIKDKANKKLISIVKELKEELSQVKKRNKQLCFILGQGEMRDKSELVQQIEQLTTVKDELSLELADMHSSLEQEKSKNSGLKNELLKYQGGRSKKQSTSETEH